MMVGPLEKNKELGKEQRVMGLILRAEIKNRMVWEGLVRRQL